MYNKYMYIDDPYIIVKMDMEVKMDMDKGTTQNTARIALLSYPTTHASFDRDRQRD
jgi:hypothetical protein